MTAVFSNNTHLRFKPWPLDLLAFITGAISLFSFPPFNYYPLIAFSMGIMYFLWQQGSLSRAIWRGWLFGLGAYGIGMMWLFAIAQHIAATDGVNPLVLAILAVILLLVMTAPLLMALCFRILISATDRQQVFIRIFAFSLVWAFIEWLRSWLFTGFPLLQPAYAFIDTPLSAWSPVLGVIGTTFVIALLVALSIEVLLSQHPLKLRLALTTIIIFIVGSSVLLDDIDWTRPSDTHLQVRLIHGTTDQHDKYKRYKVIDTIKRYLNYSKIEPTPDLVVWPESSVAFDLQDVYYLINEPAKKLLENNTTLLMGAYTKGLHKTRNVLVDANNLSQFYTKRHLVPYGEYTPNVSWLNFDKQLPQIAMNELEAGSEKQKLLSVNGIPLASTICFENLFGHEQREDWIQAQFLIQISDLGWFTQTWAADHLLQVSQMRARESGKPQLQSTNHGITAFIDYRGKITQQSDADTLYLEGKLTPRVGTTPYTNYGIAPLGLVVITGLLALLYLRSRRLNGSPSN